MPAKKNRKHTNKKARRDGSGGILRDRVGRAMNSRVKKANAR